MIKIDLDIWEWRLIDLLAIARNNEADKAGYFRAPGNRNNPEEVSFLGVAGELAFYKLIDRFPVISQDKSYAGTPDLLVDGLEVDVKSTAKTKNDLMISTDTKKHYDIYVVMAVIKPCVYYVGHYPGAEIFVPERIYTPQPKNGIARTPFYRVLNTELYDDRFWSKL
jgi:hypothetical protein